MSIVFELARHGPPDLELLAVPVCSDRFGDAGRQLDWDFLRNRGFDGGLGQSQSFPAEGVTILAVGLGRSDALGPDVYRRVGAVVSRAAKRQRVVVSTLLDALGPDADRAGAARAFAEGVGLAAYSFGRYKTTPDPSRIERVVVVGLGGKKVQAALDLGAGVAAGVCLARDLVNEPGGELTPRLLGERAQELAEGSRVEVVVRGEDEITELGLGGLLGVNRGSVEPPRLIELSWDPPGRARGTVALVGKGVTFDSGGLSIKTADGMATMKDDMGGAAAILGAFSVLDLAKPPVRVRAWIPSTDNMLGGDATRPGDVLRARGGKTIEVLNTDAEGRLILADALVLASEAEPDAIVDLATLTGACQVALGNKIAGVMGNRPSWIEQIRAASFRTDERVWELPLPADYRRQLDSEIADLRNIGTGRFGGALVAGLFLQEFVGEGLPWAHLDIAGPAWADGPDGINQKGGTGFGVRLLLELLANFRKPT